MKNKIVAGIDPGKTGALSIIFPDGDVHAHPVPLIKQRGKTVPAWHRWETEWSAALEFAGVDLIVIELVAARPGQGVSSMFTFGRSMGFAHAIASATNVRVEFVTPSVWKGKLGLLNADKNASRELFRRLFPGSVHLAESVGKGTAYAEAALIAEFGRRHL